MASRAVDRDAVLRALAECDELGEEAFLAEYGYGPAKEYFVVHNGRRYPSKAIYGVAHKFVEPDGRAVRNNEFSGGELQVARPLRALGFEVTAPEERNPSWSRDEVILALAFYVACDGNPPDKGSAPILDLSDELNRLGRTLYPTRSGTFRNPNGVYMKLMNLRSLDPRFQATGRVGLASASQMDRAVFEEYRDRPTELEAAAAAIRGAMPSKLWLIGCPGFDPSEDGAFGFTLKADRNAFFGQIGTPQYCCVWGLDDEETPPELRNRLLGLALVERTPIDWHTKLSSDVVKVLVDGGKAKENRFAAPIRQAWKIIDPPKADLLIAGLSKKVGKHEFLSIGAWFPHDDAMRLLGGVLVREVNVYGQDRTSPEQGSEPRQALDVLWPQKPSPEPVTSFDAAYGEDDRLRAWSERVVREGAGAFRKAILDAWGGRCAITGCDVPDALDAAHIHPYRGQHTNDVRNGMLLRADVHRLFDLHLLSFESLVDGLRVHVVPELGDTSYASYDGLIIRPPMARNRWPDADCLKQHRDTPPAG